MRRLRCARRLAALALWTPALALAWALGAPLAAWSGRAGPWRARILTRWSRGVLAILGARVRVLGMPPRGPGLLVANHLSYVDVPLLAAQLSCAFVAKGEVARWPAIGALARAMGTLFVEREQKRGLPTTAARLGARLVAGETLVLFPEGTSTAGAAVLPFRAPLLEPACALSLPVRYATLRYHTPRGAPPAADAVAWWGTHAFLPHLVALCALPGFEAEVRFGAAPLTARDRKHLAARLQRAVARRFVPMEAARGEAARGR